MNTRAKTVRQSVSLPLPLALRVRSLARSKRMSASRVLVDLIESGLQSREREKERFLELAERLANSRGFAEKKRLKAELAQMTFGPEATGSSREVDPLLKLLQNKKGYGPPDGSRHVDTYLSHRDAERFLDILASDPEPAPALKEALRRRNARNR